MIPFHGKFLYYGKSFLYPYSQVLVYKLVFITIFIMNMIEGIVKTIIKFLEIRFYLQIKPTASTML